jgi:aryl-alcohol dehydrogenase-like predicted oxidoreductase
MHRLCKSGACIIVMEYTTIGKSGMKISRIGLGCMSLQPDDAVSVQLIHWAIAQGVNYLDTADLYDHGLNEEMVGKAIKGKRDEIVIATKVGNRLRPDGKSWDWDASKDYIIRAVESSLLRLGTDYIDLCQLHGGTMDDPIDETISAFELLRDQGKIRHYGISSIRPNVIRAWLERSSIASVMMQYSLLDQRPAEECLDLIHASGVGVLARGAIAQGLLVNKSPRAYLQRSLNDVALARNLVHRYNGTGRTAAQTAMWYVLRHPAVSALVAGVSTKEQLREATALFDVPEMTSDEYHALQTLVLPNKYTEHR